MLFEAKPFEVGEEDAVLLDMNRACKTEAADATVFGLESWEAFLAGLLRLALPEEVAAAPMALGDFCLAS